MELVGKRVWHTTNHATGIITAATSNTVTVSFRGDEIKFNYPEAFASVLELEDEDAMEAIAEDSSNNEFDFFKNKFERAVDLEISYLKTTGGRKYKLFDGTLISDNKNKFIYSFDADAEWHFPDDTQIRIFSDSGILFGIIISCEEYTVLIQTYEALPTDIRSIEFTAEPWQLLEALKDRVSALVPDDRIAYEVACKGKFNSSYSRGIAFGQDLAIEHATQQPITFIWGPPGTGKTETLARIALQYINENKRVLMLSYSNVSVDGALLRVAGKVEHPEGRIVRYGYPRMKEILEDSTLSAHQYVLSQHPELDSEYKELLEARKKYRRSDPRRAEISKRLGSLRKKLSEEEKALIQTAGFVATTVSKAVMDPAVFSQQFDLVLFDEASMAYVPQVVFAASLAKTNFVCLGDFRQLPAIVQCRENTELKKDIFDHAGIISAVDREVGHEWLVMLNMQYRMHPDIAEFVSARMYSHILMSGSGMREARQETAALEPLPGFPMGLLDLSGLYSVCTKTQDGSRINVLSALICARYAELLSERTNLGIITPYNAQSRLILAMIRDMQDDRSKPMQVTCATVHQFQGSEKEVILYDAVDCYRMTYPGMLLTSMENQTADRLFNVAITRARGKFALLCNRDYFRRKKTSQKLMFIKAIEDLKLHGASEDAADIFSEIAAEEGESSRFYISNEEDAWNRFLSDINSARTEIHIDIPGTIDDDASCIEDLTNALKLAADRNVEVIIRTEEKTSLPERWKEYVTVEQYICMPVTIIDREVIWYGQPLSNADFIAGGEIIPTEFTPRIRFRGSHTARSLTALLGI